MIVLFIIIIEDFEFGISGVRWISLLFYLKVLNVEKFNTKMRRILQLHRKLNAVYMLVRLTFFVLFVSHIIACLFFYIAYSMHKKNPVIFNYLFLGRSKSMDNLSYNVRPSNNWTKLADIIRDVLILGNYDDD